MRLARVDLRPLRVLSLCSGIGGIELGLRAARVPHRVVCYVEGEAFCCEHLVQKMEEGALDEAPLWSDLRTFDGRPWRGAVDLVTAGYPCQPFSCAGKRKGEDDPRHLWPHVARVLGECAPSLVFLENVRNHLRVGFREVLGDLARLGFDAEWGVYSAAEAGASHKRERLFCLAYSLRQRRQQEPRGAHGDEAPDEGRAAEYDYEPSGVGETVAYRNESGLQVTARARAHGDARRQDGGRLPSSGGEAVGHSARELLDGCGYAGSAGRGELADAGFPPAPWPVPGPGTSREEWPEDVPQPAVRGSTDGIPDRVDRLRALGNAVVPAQAALAWTELAGRLLT